MHSYQAESDVELSLSLGDYVIVRKVCCLIELCFNCFAIIIFFVHLTTHFLVNIEKHFLKFISHQIFFIIGNDLYCLYLFVLHKLNCVEE